MIDPREEIDRLLAIGARGAATDAERRAAQHLVKRLEAIGRDAEAEPTWIRPKWALAYTAYAVTGLTASVVSTAAAVPALVLAAIALLLALADLGGRVHLGRRLTGRRASQNVISREDGGRPGTLILVAHHDAAQSGWAYGWPAERHAALAGRVGPFVPLIASLAAVLACAILRTAGIDSLPVEIVQFVASVVLILYVPLLVDIALSDVVPGANGNASGVATALRLAERYGEDLDHFDVWVLLPGGEDALAEGMREWMRRHRRELDPTRTVFLNVDAVGAGTIRYSRREGPLLSAAMHPRLLELCDQIAEEDADEGRYAARPIVLRGVSDALAARRSRFPAVTVSCRGVTGQARNLRRMTDTADELDDDALERAFGFLSELVELIDERIGPEVADVSEKDKEGFRSA